MWSFKKKDLTIILQGFKRETFLFTGWIFFNITALSIEGTKKGSIYAQTENERGTIKKMFRVDQAEITHLKFSE